MELDLHTASYLFIFVLLVIYQIPYYYLLGKNEKLVKENDELKKENEKLRINSKEYKELQSYNNIRINKLIDDLEKLNKKIKKI